MLKFSTNSVVGINDLFDLCQDTEDVDKFNISLAPRERETTITNKH